MRTEELFDQSPSVQAYLDTATYGILPLPVVAALNTAVSQQAQGTARWVDDFDSWGERARNAFAHLQEVEPSQVSLLPSVSVGVGVLAASLEVGDEVVVLANEFTSLLFPFLVAKQRGVVVKECATFHDLLKAVSASTTWIAFSLVGMQTGQTAPVDAIVARAAEVGARTCVDATHGLPFHQGSLTLVDIVLCAAYKHLLCPRGVAFMILSKALVKNSGPLVPILANWRSADEPYTRFFGGPLSLSAHAARFDISLAWIPIIGASMALETLLTIKRAGKFARPIAQARRLASALGVEYGGNVLVCVPVSSPEMVRVALEKAGIRAAVRGSGIRLSTHVYTSDKTVELAIETLRPFTHMQPKL